MPDTQSSFWQATIKSDLAAKMIMAARDVAGRLQNQERLKDYSDYAVRQSGFPNLIQDRAHSVSSGSAGIAIFYSQLDACFPDEGWDVVAHQHLLTATNGIEMRPYLWNQPGLFDGLSGLAFSAWSLSREETRYHKLLSNIDQKLLPVIIASAEKVLSEMPHGCSDSIYDLVSGLTGIGTYLLCRPKDHQVNNALHVVLESLVYLLGEEKGVLNLHMPPHLIKAEQLKATYPLGYVNCGLAHGIPGPLALLALALRNGINVPGIDKAIIRAADWLVTHHIEDEWGINWCTAYPIGDDSDLGKGSRTAWCYGTPGVARSLWLAGESLSRSTYQKIAIEGMLAVYRQPLSARNINSPSFCHGIAGLLQITLRFWYDTGNIHFFNATQTLSEQLIGLFDPELPLGYQHRETEELYVDNPWLLNGAAGIALVLLAASTSLTPSWDRIFLLS